jgi:hypothetical protein
MLNVASKWKEFMQNLQVLEQSSRCHYSSSISCWRLFRNGKNSLKITKYLKIMLLMITRLPSDVECWFEMEKMHSKSPSTWKACCW